MTDTAEKATTAVAVFSAVFLTKERKEGRRGWAALFPLSIVFVSRG
jgi:hypothetical protein